LGLVQFIEVQDLRNDVLEPCSILLRNHLILDSLLLQRLVIRKLQQGLRQTLTILENLLVGLLLEIVGSLVGVRKNLG
jgi:hypothetical protein